MPRKTRVADQKRETRQRVLVERYGAVLNGPAMRAKAASYTGKQGAAGFIIHVVSEIWENGKLKKTVSVAYYGSNGNGGLGACNKSRRKGLTPFSSREQARRAGKQIQE